MIPAAVRYHRAASLGDALEALAEEDARPLAGGQSLLPAMKLRLARPSLLVDIGRLDHAGVRASDGVVRIGALTTWDALARAPELEAPGLAAIRECATGIGDLQVRNVGTVGGSLAHADPASDLPATLLALGASVEAVSGSGARTIPVAALLLGPFMTSLAQGELITDVSVPVPPEGAGSAYVAIEHPASGFALAGAAALALPDGTTQVAVTGIAATPLLLAAGAGPEDALAGVEIVEDHFASAEYRRTLATVVVGRALERARSRMRSA